MSMKILIADPDSRFAAQAASYLESKAHLVAHYGDAASALIAARRWQPDLVIMAAELVTEKAMNAFRSFNPRPAIVLAGSLAEVGQTWRAWQRGGDELLMKPIFKAREIHEAIVAALQHNLLGGRSWQVTAASA
jgi:DNA-binding response OmpR family regulator